MCANLPVRPYHREDTCVRAVTVKDLYIVRGSHSGTVKIGFLICDNELMVVHCWTF